MTGETSWLDTMPEIYDRCLGPVLFAPYARYVADLAATYAPRSVLELAAGSGIVTAELVRALPDAQITATDLNPAMVSWAAKRVSGPTWLVADAQSLEFPADSFDLIVCQFGAMFFPDRPGAFAQAARVLGPGGMLLLVVWDAVDGSPFVAALVAGLAEIFPDDPPDFVERIPYGYHDADRIRADLSAGGLTVEGLEPVVLRGAVPSVRTLAEGFCQGSPLRFALEQRGDLGELTDALTESLTRRLGAGPVEDDLAALVVTARR